MTGYYMKRKTGLKWLYLNQAITYRAKSCFFALQSYLVSRGNSLVYRGCRKEKDLIILFTPLWTCPGSS